MTYTLQAQKCTLDFPLEGQPCQGEFSGCFMHCHISNAWNSQPLAQTGHLLNE